MFVFWGDGSELAKDLVESIMVRSTGNLTIITKKSPSSCEV